MPSTNAWTPRAPGARRTRSWPTRRPQLRRRLPSRALLLAGLPFVAGCDPGVLEEGAELIAEGGEILLRDTLRAPGGGPRVLIFGLDGVGHDVLRDALRGGEMPRLEAAVGGPAAYPGSLTSVLPSITVAAWTSLFTGATPAASGVPGNEWFDRTEGATGAFRAPAPVSVEGRAHALEALTDGRLGDWIRVPTVFERADVRAHVSLLPVHRGADVLSVPSAEDLADLLAAFVEGVSGDDDVDRKIYAALDEAAAEGARAARERHGTPDLQVVYFPGVDLYSHVARGAPEAQRGYLREVIDPAAGAVLDAWAEAGDLADTWVVVVADHGHTPVPSDDAHALEVTDLRGPARLLDALGWRVRPPELDVADGADHQAVVALQGAFAYVYLADRSTCPEAGDPCDWRRPPGRADAETVAAAFLDASGTEPGTPALEMVLLPRRDPAGALVALDRWTPEGPVPLAGDGARPEGFVRFDERLDWLLRGPGGRLAGDVILLARSGGWVPEADRFYFSPPYRSWHGSPHDQDSRVPLLVGRPGVEAAEVRAVVEGALPDRPTQLDFANLVLRLLGRGSPGVSPGDVAGG